MRSMKLVRLEFLIKLEFRLLHRERTFQNSIQFFLLIRPIPLENIRNSNSIVARASTASVLYTAITQGGDITAARERYSLRR